jgi:hypothetical protein
MMQAPGPSFCLFCLFLPVPFAHGMVIRVSAPGTWCVHQLFVTVLHAYNLPGGDQRTRIIVPPCMRDAATPSSSTT